VARPERPQRWRALFGVALFLCLALLGAEARASIPAMREAGPVAISTMASESMPRATDCMPCAVCYIAPTPSPHGFSGECQEREAPAWRVHALSVPAPTWFFDTGDWRLRWPVRIAFCRWLD